MTDGNPRRVELLSRQISAELDDMMVSLPDQIAVCGAVLTAAALALPPSERQRYLARAIPARNRCGFASLRLPVGSLGAIR